MHYAAAGNRAEVIALLLSASGSPMSRDLDGWLPLHVACLNGAAAAAVQLLGHTPAAAAERSDDGDAAIDIARRYGAYYVEAA
jgi:ankyrin repeat protein